MKFREKTDSKNPRVAKRNRGKLLILSKDPACRTNKLRFIKEKGANVLLSSLWTKTPLKKNSSSWFFLIWRYKMNEIVNNLLLWGNKFMREIYLRQPGFTCSTCGLFTKNEERIQKFNETENSWYIYQSKLDKASFQHGMVYGDFSGLPRITAYDKLSRDKAFNIAKNPKYDGIREVLLQCFTYFLIQKWFTN